MLILIFMVQLSQETQENNEFIVCTIVFLYPWYQRNLLVHQHLTLKSPFKVTSWKTKIKPSVLYPTTLTLKHCFWFGHQHGILFNIYTCTIKHLKDVNPVFSCISGASSSIIEEKSKLLEKILNQLHHGNFNPCVRSEMSTPDPKVPHALEMSCIPYIGSPTQGSRDRSGTVESDAVFIDTPDLVCASKYYKMSLCTWVVHCWDCCSDEPVDQGFYLPVTMWVKFAK